MYHAFSNGGIMKKSILLPIVATLIASTLAQGATISIAPAPKKVTKEDAVTIVNTSSSYIMQVEMPLPSTVNRSDLSHGYTFVLKPGELKYGLQLPLNTIMYVTATNTYTNAKSAETPVKRFFATDVIFELNASGIKPTVSVTPLNTTQAFAKGYQY